jgi:hypothetical protein
MDQGMISGDVVAKIAIYDEKIKTEKENIEANRKALKQMDEGVDQVLGRSTTETGAERAVAMRKSQQKERSRLQAEILQSQKSIAELNDARAPIAAEVRKVEAEVGPIKYIAALIYGDNTDTNMLEAAVRWVIILLVIVFDPLAIALVLAANASKEWDKEEGDSPVRIQETEQPTVTETPVEEALPEDWPYPEYEPDDGPLTEEQIEQIKESVDPAPPGWMFEKSSIIKAEPEKSIAELHPYLNQPFNHFENIKPMVAPKEEIKEEPIVEKKPKKKRAKKKVEPTIETLDVTTEEVVLPPVTKYKEMPGGYVDFEGKQIQKDALKSLRPDLFMIKPDKTNGQVETDFGTKFPETAKRGNIFVRVDVSPNRVYKFDGRQWIQMQKEQTDTYLHNQKYIEFLVGKIEKGEYDIELLSDTEREEIAQYLGNQKS